MTSTEKHVVAIGADMIVYPAHSARCLAWDAKKRTRCERGVLLMDYDAGQYKEVHVSDRGKVLAGLIFERDYPQALEQRCSKHVDEPGPNLAPTDWEWFDPDKHASLIEPCPRWARDRSAALVVRDVQPDYVPPKKLRSAVNINGKTAYEVVALYRWYDDTGRLLYIGITGDLAARQAAHVKRSAWSELAMSSTVERFSSRAEAEAAERAAIEAEDPLFNAARSNPDVAARRLIDYLINKGRADLLKPGV